MRKTRVRDLKNAEMVSPHRKGKFKDETIAKVVAAPQEWRCDRCGAVIRKDEQCIKIGKEKVCAVHAKE